MPDLDPTQLPDCANCSTAAVHHKPKEDGTLGASVIDQIPCSAYRHPGPAFGNEDPPNYQLPGDLGAMAGMPGPGRPSEAPQAKLEDVLVNYDEIFQNLHVRYFQTQAEQMQEIAELRAGFNQAVARMEAAEAENKALKQLLAGD